MVGEQSALWLIVAQVIIEIFLRLHCELNVCIPRPAIVAVAYTGFVTVIIYKAYVPTHSCPRTALTTQRNRIIVTLNSVQCYQVPLDLYVGLCFVIS